MGVRPLCSDSRLSSQSLSGKGSTLTTRTCRVNKGRQGNSWHPPNLKTMESGLLVSYGLEAILNQLISAVCSAVPGTAADVRGSRAALLLVVNAVTWERPPSQR